MKKKICLLVSLIILLTLPLPANHIEVGAITITDINTSDHYANLQFDISWDNSWKVNTGPTNWDAAWVFAKYRVGSGAWAHCTLSSTDGDHSVTNENGVASTIDATSDGTGIFIYRSSDDSGSNNWDGVKLRWNYGTDGVSDDATVDVKVFAIEMVYVPEGAFYAGDNASSSASLKQGADDIDPWYVNDSDDMVMNSGKFYYVSGGNSGEDATGSLFTIPANFPNGYDAFYCMKYEISQGQYVDFLNTLTYDQQNTRTATDPNPTGQVNSNNNRNGLEVRTAGTYNTVPAVYGIDLNNDGGNLGENIACNYLSWADGAAYSHWAGLRPMTELEFEKAGRGTLVALAYEYAWGTATKASSAYQLSNAGANYEGIGYNYSTAGNASYAGTDGTINGPLRVGIFAANGSNTGRTTSGSSYYGIMELSGNLCERLVTLGNTDGRAFTGLNGDGKLTTDGNADVNYWPDTNASCAGFRGGDWFNNSAYLSVSCRKYAAYTEAIRYYYYGFRSARTQQPFYNFTLWFFHRPAKGGKN